MKAIIIGFGEVGRAHFNILSKAYPQEIFYKDKADQIYDYQGKEWFQNDSTFDLMLLATQCDPANMGPFLDMAVTYQKQFKAGIIDVLTTTPCGTCDELQDRLRGKATVNRSSTRGLHPNLDKFLLDIPKHIGGPDKGALAAYYRLAGFPCVTHEKSRAVELAHVLNNFIYGINVMAADECAKYCRHYGVDYMEFLKYRETNNSGFIKSGYPSKVSPVLYPSGGNIGGHCVRYAPTTIDDSVKGPLAKMLEQHE